MQQRVPSLEDRISEWRERFAALPKRNGLALARAALEESRILADATEREWQTECRRLHAAGNQLHDAAATRAEAKAIAAKVRMRKAMADVAAAKEACAPSLQRHLQKNAADSLGLLIETLEQARTIARTIAKTVDVATADGGNAPYALCKARRVEVALAHALAQVSK